jgi:hypothetical protein
MKTKTNKPKHAVTKTLRQALVSSLVLVLLVAVGGVAYTWYSGRNSGMEGNPAIAQPLVYQPRQTIQRAPIPDDAKVGVSLQVIADEVFAGDDLYMSIHTVPGSTCTLTVSYQDEKTPSYQLEPYLADEYGVATWNWQIDPASAKGYWRASSLCERNGNSGVVSGKFLVK